MKRFVVLKNRISGPFWPKTAVNLHKTNQNNLLICHSRYHIGKCYNVMELMKMRYFGMLNIFSRVQSA